MLAKCLPRQVRAQLSRGRKVMAVQYAKLDHTPTVVFTSGKSWDSFLKTRSTMILVPFDFVIIFSRKSKKVNT